MNIGDSYIAISSSEVTSLDFKDAWTGSIESPVYLSVLESEVFAGASLFARINEFVDGLAEIDSSDFFTPRAAIASESEGSILGIAVIKTR